MKMQRHSRWMNIVFVVALMLAVEWTARESRAAAENYPTRPIQLVVCYPPGETDVSLRVFIEHMPEYLGQPMFFEYKSGAAGAIGASFVARAKPDGYTLIGTSPAPVILSPISKEDLNYTLDDFAPICRLILSPTTLAVKADSPWKTLRDLIEEAKKSPGKLNYAHSGTFGVQHIPMEVFSKMAGVQMIDVPCRGSAASLTALLGGHVNLAVAQMASVLPHIKAGAVRPLASFTKERIKSIPYVPTFSELGYPIVFPNWYGLMAPRGVPKEVLEKILTAMRKVVEQRKELVEDRSKALGVELAFLGPEEWTKELNAMSETSKQIIKDLKEKLKK